ncbi:hypothetical protein RhiirA5_433238 [Rhizophagus irregularis]|uniref:Uncharacterized protein n=1 Tax=Rhizophagus irregularis TaxID=588596 RepID=A0A2N0NS73_9GLOM|nr:hypothetical protein RhiirA5_433238 [Rhizophagus irregularis]
MRLTLYDLPEKAIEKTRQALVYHIKEKLKKNLRYVGGVCIMIICIESQFFGIFKEYIHDYYPKMGNYKCIFKGISSYHTLLNVLEDDNWKPDSLQEHNPLQEPLQDQNKTSMHIAKK